MHRLAPQGRLQPIGDVAPDLAADMNWRFVDRGIKRQCPLDRPGRGLVAADHLDKRHEMRRIERVADHTAFGVPAIGLNAAHQQPRRAGGDNHRRIECRVEPREQRALEVLALGAVFLDKIRIRQRRLRLRMEGQRLPGRRVGQRRQAREARPGRGDKFSEERLGPGRRVARRDMTAARQEHRCPACADRSGADHCDPSDGRITHGVPPAGSPHRRGPTGFAKLGGVSP
jgi:hypothetical protein